MSGQQTIRLFIASKVPESVKGLLGQAQREMRERLPQAAISWTKPDSMHLTLRFLGNVEVHCVPELKAAVSDVVSGLSRFELVSERLGCFPDLRFPRVVWAWVHDVDDRLPELVKRLEQVVGRFAEKPSEDRFVGHVTLARIRQIDRTAAGKLARSVEDAITRRFGAWTADTVELIQSELSPSGSRYTTLADFRLQ
jgi:2'-5' RNA ligase